MKPFEFELCPQIFIKGPPPSSLPLAMYKSEPLLSYGQQIFHQFPRPLFIANREVYTLDRKGLQHVLLSYFEFELPGQGQNDAEMMH